MTRRWSLREKRDAISGRQVAGVSELIHPNGGTSGEFYDTDEPIGRSVANTMLATLNSETHEVLCRAADALEAARSENRKLRQELAAAESRLDKLRHFENAVDFQSIVADALLWFDGFAAAVHGMESWDRPSIPDRERLRVLNGRLQDLIPHPQDTIPF